ncbi:MAG: DUF6443 domain-containing protein, partial [Bacteroidota bacterium]
MDLTKTLLYTLCFLSIPHFGLSDKPAGMAATISLSDYTICSSQGITITVSGLNPFAAGTVKFYKATGQLFSEFEEKAFEQTTTVSAIEVVSESTSFYAVVDYDIGTDETTSVATVNQNTSGAGTLVVVNGSSGTHELCVGSQVSLQNENASGGSPLWYYSEEPDWASDSWQSLGPLGATASFQPTINTKYKVGLLSVPGTCVQNPESNIITVVLTQPTVAGNISAGSSFCGTSTENFDLCCYTGTILRWESRFKNGSDPWQDWDLITVDDTTAVTKTLSSWSGGPRTYEIKATVQSGTCASQSVVKSAVVYPEPNAGAITSGDSFCGTSTETFNLIGAIGDITRWEWRYQNQGEGWSTWDPITTSNTTSITRTLTASPDKPRTYQISAIVESGSCDDVPPAIKSVVVYPELSTGTLTGDAEYFGKGFGRLELQNYVGAIERWEINSSGSWFSVPGTDDFYDYANLQQPTSYQVLVSSGPCGEGFSNEVLVNVLSEPSIDLGSSQNLRPGQSTTLSTDPSHAQYQWFRNDTEVPNEADPTLLVEKPGAYYLVVTSQGGATFTTGEAIVSDQLAVNQNAVLRITPTIAVNASNFDPFDYSMDQMDITCELYNGLGMPSQSINLEQSHASNDVIVPYEYDEVGRNRTKYLPYTEADKTLLVRPAAVADQLDYYANGSLQESNPYSVTRFEPSPLNRPMKQGAPGSAWQPDPDPNITTDNVIHYSYEVNRLSDHVYIWDVDLMTADLTAAGHYPNGQLSKTVTTDEAGHAVIEFVDKQGQTVLKRVQAVQAPNMTTYTPGEWADTYYVYDDFGDLRYVLPPEAVKAIGSPGAFPYAPSPTLLATWTFQYEYDGRRRMTEKKVPGADWVYMVYDDRDRLVLTQDGNQRNTNEWLFTKYDGLNRPIVTGKYADDSDRPAMQ